MSDTLRLVFWELTARCNLACKHCRAEARDHAVEGELGKDALLRVARDIREVADPILILTGGEPLTHPDFFELAEACCGLFSRVALATNGTLVDEALAQRIAATGIQRVSVSLDGAHAATHDAFRGQPGSFDAALRGLAALRGAGLSVQVNATVTRANLDEVAAILDVAMAHGADAFHLFVLVPVGCGAELGDDMRLTPAETDRVLRWLHGRSLALRGRVHVKATCAPQYYRLLEEQRANAPTHPVPPASASRAHHGMEATTRGCLAGSAVCFVSRTGDVQPCGYLPLVVGNVCREPFSRIWFEAPAFVALREPAQLGGSCGACGYRDVCGGCRARAFAAGGDYLGEDPDCAYAGSAPRSGHATKPADAAGGRAGS